MEIIEEKAKELAGDYAHESEQDNGFDFHPKSAAFQGFYSGYIKGHVDGYQAGLDEFALAEIQAYEKGLAQKDAEWQEKVKKLLNTNNNE